MNNHRNQILRKYKTNRCYSKWTDERGYIDVPGVLIGTVDLKNNHLGNDLEQTIKNKKSELLKSTKLSSKQRLIFSLEIGKPSRIKDFEKYISIRIIPKN